MKIFGASLATFLSLIAAVGASILFIVGAIVAEVKLPEKIDFGVTKINEQKVKKFFSVESKVTEQFNFTASCSNPNLFSASIELPVGSSVSAPIALNNNGTTFISPNVTVGNATLTMRSLVQGNYNCSILPGYNPLLFNITWVSELN